MNKNIIKSTSRIPYIDVMKGILILMVIYGHLFYALSLYANQELTNFVYQITAFVSNTLIAPDYMAAFFCITGYCSNFSKSLSKQVSDDFRRLVIPGIVISIFMTIIVREPKEWAHLITNYILNVRIPWFVMALFFAKLIIRLMLSYINNRTFQLSLLTAMSVVGCYMMGKFASFNYLSIFQAFAFALFVYLGCLAREKAFAFNHAYLYGLVFIGLCSVLTLIKYPVPALCSHITFGLKSWPLFLILATTGTLGIYYISRIIKENCILEYLGRNSLVIYLTHFAFLILASQFIPLLIEDVNESKLTAVAIIIAMLIGSIFWSVLWIQVLNTRYLSWIIGKTTK